MNDLHKRSKMITETRSQRSRYVTYITILDGVHNTNTDLLNFEYLVTNSIPFVVSSYKKFLEVICLFRESIYRRKPTDGGVQTQISEVVDGR